MHSENVSFRMTNYAHNIFGHDLNDLTEENITDYFTDQRLENDTLEFKSFPINTSFDPLMLKIIRTICGFLNGSGGILILGAPVKTVVGNIDYFQGALTPLPVQKSVDWYINKVCTGIVPMPINISVKIIQAGDNYIYVFEVQESKYKPHQTDHIYYIRLDGQTRPAPHYIVQALMRQITYPDLRASIRINPFTDYVGQTLSKMAFAIFNFSQLQNDTDYNYTITITGGAKFLGWENEGMNTQIKYGLGGAQLIHRPIPRTLHFGIPYAVTYHIIIPPNVGEIKIMIAFGARLSPSKSSLYTLNLNNINPLNPIENLVIEHENKLFEAKQSIDEGLAFFRNNEVL